MKVGDLVKCDQTGSHGIITKIAAANPYTGNTEWIYYILWTKPKHATAGLGLRWLAWASAEKFTLIPNEECVV